MLVAFLVAQDADGRRGPGFHTDHDGIVGQESFGDFTEIAEAFAQAAGDELRHPEMQRGGQQAGCIRRFGEIERVLLVHEVDHPLRRGGLLHPTVQPAKFFQPFLESHQR